MTIRMYDREIREIYHDLGYWIINCIATVVVMIAQGGNNE